ncbi:MAG: LamG domain-containing protein, partial [Patescibacteria group bacterium]
GSGTRAYDSDGTAHGTLTNMTDDDWVNSLSDKDQSALSQQVLGVDPNWPSGPARRSYSLDFDGSADYISAGTSLNVTGTTITVDAWIKSDATSYVDIPIIVSKWVNGGSAGNQFALIVNGASGCVAMFGTDTGSAAATYATGTTNVCDGKWYHLAGVQDGTSVRIYVNGKQENSNTPVNTMTSQTTNATIGNKSGLAANQWWNGKIDEIRISNSARYSSSFTPSYRFKEDANTVALWHFDEGENNTCSGGTNDVCDSSSNGYDGAETSTPTWVTDSLAVMDNNARYLALGSSSAVNTDRGMELKITSTTAFQYRWQGDQTWTTPSTSTLSSYSFSSPSQIDSTGVYVGFDTTNGVFGDESYFLIPSWAIEQFSDSDTQNAMRGTKRGFPERSYLVATDKGVDILNADDNTLWMRMEQGSGRSLGTDFNNDPSSVFMVHGSLFIGTNGSAGTGLYRFDFNRDKIYRYDATDRRTNTVNIAKRNTSDSSYGSADTAQNLLSSIVNDASALTIQAKIMLAAATDTGVTKISNVMSSDTSYDYSDNASDDYGHVVLAETAGGAGDLYADNDTTDALERWNNVLDDAASETAGTPDTTYDESSTPAIFVTAATEINDLKLTNQTSTVEAASPTIYLAHNLGTTVLAEKRSDPTNGSVKYENVSRITEEMVGDTNGMWSLDDVNDSSVKANTLTNNASVTFTTSGVRGKSAHFTAASSQYLSKADNASLSTGDIDFTVAAWVYLDSVNAYQDIVTKWGSGTNEYLLEHTINSDFIFAVNGGGANAVHSTNAGANPANTWLFVVAWHDSVNNQLGISVNNGSPNTTAYSSGVPDGVSSFNIGTEGNGWGYFMDGRIDEVMFTKEVLTAAQRTQLYVAGKEALNNKYRVKLASDTVNQLAGSINVVKGVAASDQYIFTGTNTTGADDGILSRTLLRGDVTDRTYDESTTDPIIVDNDISSVSVSSDGAYIIVGSDDSGITIIQNGSNAIRLRGGSKVQGPSKRPSN